jgi:hypothetical protein
MNQEIRSIKNGTISLMAIRNKTSAIPFLIVLGSILLGYFWVRYVTTITKGMAMAQMVRISGVS